MSKYLAPMFAATTIAILAIAAWLYSLISSERFIESITKFDIPFGTKIVSEHHDSARLGAESLRITVYELERDYARKIAAKCSTLGYSILTREEADQKFPSLSEYLVGDAQVCARKDRSESLKISLLQNNRVIVLVLV